ncbi:CRISPR-associated helicase Cas3' [Caloranaerobacter sp. DY30410]|uniref:CRISPR-associated helicase Cas3' n=1 Tax=Caloranaerobacter sp. DY30410 TaxID=3238305 RepID=UPI003D033377
MKRKIFAKSDNKITGQRSQTLVEHIEDLLEVFDNILAIDEKLSDEIKNDIRLLCLLHDLGKINIKFQRKIELANKEANEGLTVEEKKEKDGIKDMRHNILSGAFLKKIFDKLGLDEDKRNILYKSIMLHHGSFIKYLELSSPDIEESIYYDIEKGILENDQYTMDDVIYLLKENLNIDFDYIKEEMLDYDYLKYLNQDFRENKDLNIRYIIYKGFLNLIDHLASSQIKDYNYYNPFTKVEIDKALKENIAKKIRKEPEEVKFNSTQELTSENEDKNILTIAFTGSGKTVADHRWTGKRKFYLVPNKISAESFYFDALKLYKDEKNVGLLHGDIHLYTYDEEEHLYISLKDEALVRNFAKPYIISTIDQLILAMYKHPNYEKTFASIYNSKVTVDEVHLLTPQMFLMLICFMQFTTKYLNTKYHLMTATLPKAYLDKLEKSGIDYVYNSPSECQNADNENRRIKLFLGKTDKDIEKIIKNVKGKKKVLIVVNTIDRGIELYRKLEDIHGIEVNLLHSRFKFNDKKEKYDGILNQKGDIWIATQMVEVSLDLDFPIVISDLAPMDSLIQRMGRCNRHDTVEIGEFYILEDREDVYDKKLKKATEKILKSENNKIITLNDRKQLLEAYYNNKEVLKYYDEEFKKAEEYIKTIFGINKSTEIEIKGEDLIFNFEPYKNLVDSKKEAGRLFRDGQLNVKVILEEDYYKIKNSDNKMKELSLNSILISQGLLRKFGQGIRKEQGIFIIRDGYYEYDKEVGLIFKEYNSVDSRFL